MIIMKISLLKSIKPSKIQALVFSFGLGISIPTVVVQSQPQNQPNIRFTQSLVRTLYSYYLNQQPIPNIVPNLTLSEGYKIQREFVTLLTPYLGKSVGYKVGLTNPDIQKKLQINHPVSGVLLEKMLLKNGAKVKANFGAVPRLEGDLIVRIGSDKINQAKTLDEVIESLDAVIPFIELPDLMYQQIGQLTGTKLVIVNVGARYGVVGEPILLLDKTVWKNKLSRIQLIIKDQNGHELHKGTSQTLLGDPLKVVLWLKDHLKFQGQTLKQGDLISLGTITPFLTVQSGQTITAHYEGLNDDKPVEISVTFID